MLGLTISRRAIQVPTKRFATRSISRPTVSFRPRISLATDTGPSYRFQTSFKIPFTRFLHHETVGPGTSDTPETSSEQQEVGRREEGLSRYVVLKHVSSARLPTSSPYSDERYMVARILVGTTMSIITRMDNPQWFKENAEPHVFSQTRYDKTVEDLKALGTEDPNAVQALVRDVPFHPLVGVLNSQ